jgi:hypothetical protein
MADAWMADAWMADAWMADAWMADAWMAGFIDRKIIITPRINSHLFCFTFLEPCIL